MDLALFVVHMQYRQLDQLPAHHAAHAEWIEKYAASGTILLAGPTTRYDSGVLLARAPSRDALLAILAEDAFARAGLVTHEITEFTPRRGSLRHERENPLYLTPGELEEAFAKGAF